jgi:hypothetical protein
MTMIYVVTYPKQTPPADGSEYPILNGCGFRFRANADAYAKLEAGRKVKRVRLDTSGFRLSDFRDEPRPAATPASGGKRVRQIRRTVTGARWERYPRRRGMPGSTLGLGMRPPGCGAVEYQGKAKLVSRLPSGRVMP